MSSPCFYARTAVGFCLESKEVRVRVWWGFGIGLLGGGSVAKARMEKVLGVFKPKPSPQEQLREWQRKLRQESRDVDRQVRGE